LSQVEAYERDAVDLASGAKGVGDFYYGSVTGLRHALRGGGGSDGEEEEAEEEEGGEGDEREGGGVHRVMSAQMPRLDGGEGGGEDPSGSEGAGEGGGSDSSSEDSIKGGEEGGGGDRDAVRTARKVRKALNFF
jgi:hypothetical protein